MIKKKTDDQLAVKLALAWGFVSIPLVFGIVKTLANVMNLFR